MGQQVNMVLPVLVLVLLQINLSSLSFVPNHEILENNLDNPNPEFRALAESRIDFASNWDKMLAKLVNDLISLAVKTALKYLAPDDDAAAAASRRNKKSKNLI